MKSDLKGFTPRGEDLEPTNIDGLIPCILMGPNVIRHTVIRVKPGRVKRCMARYNAPGQTIIPPKSYDLSGEEDVIDLVDKPLELERKQTNVELILCLNNGKMFEGRKTVARKFNMTAQMIGEHLRGKAKQAKGHVFRVATEAEREAYYAGAFEYSGQLVPVGPSRR